MNGRRGAALTAINFLIRFVAMIARAELMGDRDNETHAVRDCVPMLEPLKSSGNPIEYRLYHATQTWDARETRIKPFSKRGTEKRSSTNTMTP